MNHSPSIPSDWQDEPGPVCAQAWADAIARYWQQAATQGQIDARQPLDVLDLVPGTAAATRRMLTALTRALDAWALDRGLRPNLRFLVCTADGGWPPAWCDVPELRTWIEAGVLAPLTWSTDAALVRDCDLRLSANPAVLIARRAWSRLEQELLAVHYGELLSCRLDVLSDGTMNDTDPWRPWPGGDALHGLDDLIDGYRANLNSAPIGWPLGALRTIDHFAQQLPQGWMLLALDEGPASHLAMRLTGFEKVWTAHREQGRLPVNFHALGEHLRRCGAAVWTNDAESSAVLQIAVKAATGTQSARMGLAYAIEPLRHDRFSAAQARVLGRIMQKVVAYGDSQQALALLQLSQHDPCVFAQAGPRLHRQLLTRPDCNRMAWREALTQVWNEHVAATDAPPLHLEVASCAIRVDAWALARSVLWRGMAAHGSGAAELALLAWCDARTGRPEGARSLIERASAKGAQHPMVIEVRQRLERRAALRDDQWRSCQTHPGLPLVLEPLDADHADAMLHQYRDPQIAVMTGLPALANAEAVRAWIEQSLQEEGRHDYAVMHGDAGLLGHVSLHVSEEAANFCFWMGADHQGRGMATPAGRLLCDLAFRRGVDWIFASAFHDNVRSLRALERIGFQRMGLRSTEPNDPRTFLFRSRHPDGAAESVGRFVAYLQREKAHGGFICDSGEHITLERILT
ncbi:MAG: N-acetyltransferase [Comamonadaceae bacterium]|nr:MAG: N-acetyltransferase [Comamonadaceae bacterium]